MCRFLAYLTTQPTAPAELLADGALKEFVALSRENKDGWGLAWHDEGDELRVAKAPEPADSSTEFDRLAETVRTGSLIMHLRSATRGLGLGLEDTHPFVRNGHRSVAFAHNGAVKPVEGLEELLPAQERASLAGTTDSERLFLAAIGALENDGADEEGALREVLRAVDGRCAYTSLNFLMLTRERLYAVCRYDPDHPDARYYLGRNPDYFRLWYKTGPGSFVVASTGWRAGGRWETLESGQALVVERGTLKSRTLQVA